MDVDLVPVEAAAAEFNLHRATLFRWIADGHLQSHKAIGDRRTFVSRAQLTGHIDSPDVTRCLNIVYVAFRETTEWPRVTELQRAIDRSKDGFDLVRVIESLPQELGYRVRDQEGRAQLRLRGLARCDGSAEDVAAFLGLVRTSYERYLESDDSLEISSAELAERFGWDAATVARVFRILETEPVIWSGLGKTEYGWTLQVNAERIRYFNDVVILSDYLAAAEQAFSPQPSLPITSDPEVALQNAATAQLHPVITTAVGDNVNGTQAVMAAATALERLIANHLGSSHGRYGRPLIDAFCDAARRGAPEPRRVEAMRTILLGALGAYRNPAAHGRIDFDGAYAHEIVVMYSLLAREVDALSGAVLADRAGQPTSPWTPPPSPARLP